jgi:uncharacterized protein (TIGR03437 family)
LAAQTPTADVSTVTINYTGTAAANTGTVNVSNATNLSARISVNIDGNGNPVSAGAGVSAAGVFVFNTGGSQVFIGTDNTVLGALARRGLNSYTGHLLISATGCTDCLDITLQLNITSGTVGVLYNGAAVPTAGIVVNAGVGQTVSTNIVLTSTSTTSYTVTTGATWLTASPQSGNVGPGANPQQASITLFANALGLTPQALTTTVTVAAGGATAASFKVTFNVGSSSVLTLSPNPMNFQYATSTQSFTSGQTQYLTISGASQSAVYTASSSQSWLMVSGGQTVSNISVLQQLPVSVNVAFLGSAAGTYSGLITISTSDGQTAQETVNLTITNTGSTTTSLTFTVPSVGGSAPPQTVSLTGSGLFTAFANPNSNTICGASWLQVSPSSGTLSAAVTNFTVSVFPGTIPATTCNGNITISTTGTLQNGASFMTIPVSMVIGGGTTVSGVVASPNSLVFNIPQGGSQTQSFIVNGDGSAFTASVFGTGLTIFPTSGSTPAVITVAAAPGAGSGTISVSSSLGSQTIPVTVNSLQGNVLLSNPAALSFIYNPGANITANLSITASGADVSGGGQLTFSVASAPSFISYSAPSTTTATAIGIGVNASALAPGFNTGTLVLSANLSANATLSIPVTVLAPGATQGLSASPSSVSLNGVAGGSPVSQTVYISGVTGTSFNATASSANGWLSVTPNSATTPATLTITASPFSLVSSTYTGQVTITTSTGASFAIPVTLNTTGTGGAVSPVLSLGTTSVNLTYRQGDPAPTGQTVQVTATNGNANFTVTTDSNWITVTPTSGSTPGTLTISLNPSLVRLGSQTGKVTVTAPGATGSPQVITVTANVSAPPVLSLDTNAASFTYRIGESAPAPQTVQVSSTGSALSFTVSVSNAPWLSVSPTSGTTPATLTLTANPGQMAVGQYPANVVINATGSSQTVAVTLAVSAPLPTVKDVLNAASNLPGPVSPGEIVTIVGTNLGPDLQVNYTLDGDLVPTLLSNTRVSVGGFRAPVLYTSSTQVSAIIPYGLAGRTKSFVSVQYLGQSSNGLPIDLAPTAPGIYTQNATGTGPGQITNEDGSPNTQDNPAAQGSVITVTATGEGQTIPAGIDGKLADDPNSIPKPVLPVTATIDGLPATVVSSGAIPNQVAGMFQAALRVPVGAQDGGKVLLFIGTAQSQDNVTVWIK